VDALTAHYIARELATEWRGARIKTLTVSHEKRAVVVAAAGLAVEFDFSRGTASRLSEDPGRQAAWAGWVIRDVVAPTDERRIELSLAREGKFRGSAERSASLALSFRPTARGAALRDGARVLASFGSLGPAAGSPRPELTDDDVRTAAAAGDTVTLMRGRWVSPAIARWLLSDPLAAVERYRLICSLPPARPTRCGDEVLPLPVCAGGEPVPALLASRPPDGTPSSGSDDRTTRARRRMERELARAEEAPRLREAAERLSTGADGPAPSSVLLSDGAFEIAVERGETAHHAAQRLFRRARAMERALERLPQRIARLEAAPGDVRAARPSPAPRVRARKVARPFREYRSSGGLAIWVGRGAASNDQLTFREATPDDVWLHARGVSGAHVVLRWPHATPPPARDLEEAATLAAWHSRARGSTVVAVDWTRRRHVRKPRQAAPGSVVAQQTKTVFVRPTALAERRLRPEA